MNNESLRRDGLYHEQCGRTYTARHAADGLSTRVSSVRRSGPRWIHASASRCTRC